MSVVDDALDARDVELLARMHVEALPESLVSLIGPSYARAFYRYIADSPDERVLLHREHGALVAACIVSLRPETLARRLLTRSPLLLHAPRAVRRLPLRAMARSARTPGPAHPQPVGPEILLIFTVASARSAGLGARMLARCEADVATTGYQRLLVKTRDVATNRAIPFYERSGFRRIAQVTKFGKRLLLFEKPVPTTTPGGPR